MQTLALATSITMALFNTLRLIFLLAMLNTRFGQGKLYLGEFHFIICNKLHHHDGERVRCRNIFEKLLK